MTTASTDDRAERRVLFLRSVMRDLLVVFKAYVSCLILPLFVGFFFLFLAFSLYFSNLLRRNDPIPSVIAHPIPHASPSPHGGPPSKRTKLSPSAPNTIADKLEQGLYTSLATIIKDVSFVCSKLLESAPSDSSTNGARPEAGGTPFAAQLLCFEELAKQIITQERLRRADLFDFAEEMADDCSITKPVTKVALTVMGQHGPLFSSLQNPIAVPPTSDSAPSSRATSMSASPKSSQSTAPTSAATSPKASPLKEYPVYTSLDESSLPPLISTVKAIPSTGQVKASAVEKPRVPTLGEAFPQPRGMTPLSPPKPAQSGSAAVGLKWGGDIGIGGVRLENPMNDRREACGEWLRYRNHPPPNHPKARRELVRLGIGLPADVVAAYSSFAPTRDDSGCKVPAFTRNRVWWHRVGRKSFRKSLRRQFLEAPDIDDVLAEHDDAKVDDAGQITRPTEEAEEEEQDLEEVFRKAIDEWGPDENIPIDSRLLNGSNDAGMQEVADQENDLDPEKILPEISNLLQSLRSQQYIRLSTVPPVPPSKAGSGASPVLGTPSTPSEEELTLYNAIKDRLALLISRLPPHLVATIDGDPDGDLNVSSKVPILEGGTPVFKGTLPSDDAHLPKGLATSQVQGAAMAAMNAAAGLSPVQAVNAAPIAMMTPMRQNAPVPQPASSARVVGGLPNISVGGVPTQTYHGHQLPPQPQHYHGHSIPPNTLSPSVTTPHHQYASPPPLPPPPPPPPPPPYTHTPPPPPSSQPSSAQTSAPYTQQYPISHPPPPRVVSPQHNHHNMRPHPSQPQFHGHSLPPTLHHHHQHQPGFVVPADFQPTQRRHAPPPPPTQVQGLEAVGVGYGGGIRMSTHGTPTPGGRRGGRR